MEGPSYLRQGSHGHPENRELPSRLRRGDPIAFGYYKHRSAVPEPIANFVRTPAPYATLGARFGPVGTGSD